MIVRAREAFVEKNSTKGRQRGSNNKLFRSLALAGNLGLSTALPIVGGALLGSFLDNKFGTSPKMTLSSIFIGIIISVANIYFTIKEIDKN